MQSNEVTLFGSDDSLLVFPRFGVRRTCKAELLSCSHANPAIRTLRAYSDQRQLDLGLLLVREGESGPLTRHLICDDTFRSCQISLSLPSVLCRYVAVVAAGVC